jgi:hypothetical protein
MVEEDRVDLLQRDDFAMSIVRVFSGCATASSWSVNIT